MINIIDCKGLQCPLPVVKTKKYFESIENGESTVIVDNLVAKNNIVKLAEGSGYKSVVEEKEELYYIKITKENNEVVSAPVKENKKFTLVVSTNKLGEGDDNLGDILMKSYVFALSEADLIPNDILFINGGVKLTVDDSPVLGSLKKLVERGANILVCGVCLDFYNIKDKLSVGEISNMYTIVQLMNNANNTIKL
ncbi:sulfurtransferase-like selenium metabolism protein YedF [Clostridium bowmanii]|uniref:sulfurtransferase-like selenium metabolism protein YedF n=1 Tax=Clostridium bowmanii TaxID=132925 RepID=UPI001C0C6D71|nr:sulfurtransferase-like selenium metabolism protein YedF [Clostridium bowmanii]MBU3190067.1 sulfurtransferase-like selenium metabolism protein YedF [Clostridium bowmanii]MCA1074662.1 sulfurtransferase-like selenium metabolism protein YedF [Clostridium bowmanii]